MLARLIRMRHVLTDPARASVAAGWGGRIVAALAQFGAIRILTQMLGVDGYGAYAVVTGLLAWFLLADLGLGASLQNHISERRIAGESADAAIWSTAAFLTLTTVVLTALLVLAAPWAGPFLLDRFPGVTTGDAQAAFLAFGVLTGATAAANIVLKIFFGQHRGYLAHAVTTAAAICGVLLLAMLERVTIEHKLVWAIVAFYLPGWVFPAIAISHYLLRSRHGIVVPRFGFDPAVIRVFWRSARWFVLFAALGALTLNLDYVILSRTVSAADVAIYSVFAKVYTLILALFGSVMSAYWPVSSELIRTRRFVELRALMRRALLIGVVITIVVSFGIALFRGLIGRLLSPDAPLDLPLAFVPAFTLYCLLRVWTDTFSMTINSAGRAWFLCLVVPVQAALSLGIGYWAALHYGPIGVVAGLILSYLLTVAWALPLYVKLGIVDRAKDPQ